MLTLSKGFKKPQTGDKGSVFFPALETNWQQVNDHTHNGTNSQLLGPAAVTAESQTLGAGSWVSVGGGVYRQLVTMPAGLTYTNNLWKYLHNTSSHELHLATEYVSATTFYVYVNDNSISVKVIYK